MEALHVKLFGGFELMRGNGELLELHSRKSVALIAYLALHPGRQQSREKLACLLWDERPEPQARASLRQVLLGIRRLIPDRPFIVEPRPDCLALDERNVDIDTQAFARALARGGCHDLVEAAGLVRGELLEGVRVRSESFEAWLALERQRLRSEVLEALHLLLEAEQPEAADEQFHIAQKTLTLDPASETAHRTLIRLYARSGRRAEALRQYFRCRDALWRELSVRPEAATDLLYNSVLTGAERAPIPMSNGWGNGGRPNWK